jgi:hypothetical protein
VAELLAVSAERLQGIFREAGYELRFTPQDAFRRRYEIMAIRRKKTKSRAKIMSFKTGVSKPRKKYKTDSYSQSSIKFLKVLAVVCVVVAIVVGFVFLNKYVKKVVPSWPDSINVVLSEPPVWVNESLRDKITTAAIGQWRGESVKLDEDAARLIQGNLDRNIPWLKKITVRTTHDRILIEADYRKPLALVKFGQSKFYVDDEMVVLDFIPMPNLPIVRVKGSATIIRRGGPPMGKVWLQEDIAAAVSILARLDRMDQLVTPDKPLLFEIDSIDVSNFKGRENSKFAHIILYAKNNTEIIWGAEIDAWAQYLEAKDEEKLAKLYTYYKEYGLLTGSAKYIDLRTPQSNVPLPVDKY